MVVGNKLKVTVINGRGLKCKDSNKEVAPYCVLQSGATTHQTKSISNNSNPQWNEDFVLDVDPGCEVLSFSIWHKNISRNDVVIGYAFVDFGSCKKGEKTTINIQLQGIYTGEIKLSIFPMYETTASKVERLEREILLLTYELTNHTNRNELLTKQVSDLTTANETLIKTNTLLEHEKNTLLEYEILSCTSPPTRRGTYGSLGYDILSCGSPRARRALSSSVFEYDTDKKQLNGTTDTKSSLEDEFDIISERDIDCALHKNKKNSKIYTTSPKLVDDVTTNGDVNKYTFTFTSECEHEQSQSVEILEDEVDRWHRTHKQQKYDKLNEINMDILVSKVTYLEEENTELKLFIQEMQLETGDELSQLIDELDGKEECEHCDETIKNKVAQIRRLKYQNDAKISLLKELILSLSDSVDRIETNEFEENERNYEERNINLECSENEVNEQCENEDDDFSTMKTPNEPDVIKEYFWDEYLPISTGHSRNDLESTDKMFDDVTNIVDGITDDIDDFIKNNYLFHNGNTMILRSDPELYTRSQMKEENEHFKEINIRLIKENEELDGCLQLLQVQVENLKKIQTILFDQLIKRAPKCMRNIIDKFTDYSQVLDEDQVTLYTSHLGSVLDEIVTVAGGEVQLKDTPRSDSYKFAVSLLHQHLSAT